MIIAHGLLALPGKQDLVRADIRVSDGRIVEIGTSLSPAPGEDSVSADGMQIFPGAIDPHVHFDTPGFEQREDFTHGSMAAARGGVTTIIDMPCTSLPPVTSLSNFREKFSHVGKASVIDFGLYGGVSGHIADECINTHMAELAPYVVGFKTYFISGMDSFTHINHYDFARVIARASQIGRPVLLHAEDLDYITAATRSVQARARARAGTHAPEPAAAAQPVAGYAAAGPAAPGTWADYVEARPEAAERVAAATALALAHGNEGTLHVVHVGTAEAAELLAAGGATCETCTHYLEFSSADFDRLGAALKTAPPVKSPGHAERLWSLLAGGSISFVTSDHAPAPEAEKHTGSIWTDYGGIPGTGTLFPYVYSEGYRSGRLSLYRFLEVISSAAARRFGLAAHKGSIEVGKDADFAFVDPEATYEVKGSELLSKGTITPFEGMRLRGKVTNTFVRGVEVWNADDGIVVDPGSGNYLQWGY